MRTAWPNIRRWPVFRPLRRLGTGAPATRKRVPRSRVVVLLAVLLLLALGHTLVLRLLTWPLVAGDSSLACDYFCLHGGELGAEGYDSFERAAEWHRQQAGRKILLLLPRASRLVEIGAVRSFEEACRSKLGKCGIPAADIQPIRAEALDVWDEAHALSNWLKERPDATVRLACSSFGSGRLRFVLDKVLGPADAKRVQLAKLPDPACSVDAWWRSREGVKEFMYAWLELIYARTYGEQPRVYPLGAAQFQAEMRARFGEAPP
jgi:hypothetical protein